MTEKGVSAVDRALSILDCFQEGQDELSLKDLAQQTGLYKSTILRLCASLEKFGYVRRRDDGRFQLGPTPWRLGVRYRKRFDLAAYVRPVLKQLSEATGESASYYVRDGDTRVCLLRHNSSQPIRHHLEEGAQLPLTQGAAGHLIRAYSDGSHPETARIKKDGFCISLGERDPDTASIAVPIQNAGGELLGALVISGLRRRFDEDARTRAISLAHDAARKLAQDISA